MREILVADIMTRDPIKVKPTANLLECAKTMVRKRVGSLLIVDKKRLVGFLSQRDILWAIVKQPQADLKKIKAIDISPKKIAKIRPTRTIGEAISKMKKLKFERLPVIENAKLVGIITSRDILTYKPEIYPELEEFARIREESRKMKQLSKIKETVRDGICEECGSRGILQRFNGMLVCESCIQD